MLDVATHYRMKLLASSFIRTPTPLPQMAMHGTVSSVVGVGGAYLAIGSTHGGFLRHWDCCASCSCSLVQHAQRLLGPLALMLHREAGSNMQM